MRVRSSEIPAAKVVVDTIGDKTTISLWNGEYDTIEAEQVGNEVEGDEQRESTYEYDLYLIDAVLRPNLKESVLEKFDVWYEAAKKKEMREQSEKMLKDAESTLTGSLAQTLLDLDCRIAILESDKEVI